MGVMQKTVDRQALQDGRCASPTISCSNQNANYDAAMKRENGIEPFTGGETAAATYVAGGGILRVVKSLWGAVFGGAAVETAAFGANSAVNGLKLEKSLASQAQMGEAGTTMAGVGARVPFRDAQRIAAEHGGNPADWVKRTSSSHTARDGATFETHWVENIKTGQRVEFKTKFPGGD